MTVYEFLASQLVAAGYHKPAIYEQVCNYVLTSQGHDAAGHDNVGKYVNLPGIGVAAMGAAFLLFGVNTAVGLEKVGNIALLHA